MRDWTFLRSLGRAVACATSMAVSLSIASPAAAVDGVIEINQAKASTGSVTAGDAPGFPVTISVSGSYALTSDLVVGPGGTGIQVTADEVTIDLNGFTLSGPVTCTGIGSTVNCVGGGGSGILASGQERVTVRNGVVRGFAGSGVAVGDVCQLSNLTVTENAGDGINAGAYCVVRDNVANINGDEGIVAQNASSLEGNVARGNKTDGINAGNGSLVLGNSAWDNGGDGFDLEFGVVARSNSSYINEVDGFDVRGGALVKGNVGYANGGFQLRTQTNTAYQDNVFRLGAGPNYVTGGTNAGGNTCGGLPCP